MDTKNFAIGVLSTTAVILLVGVIVIQTRPNPAIASGMTTSGGAYVITVGSSTIDDEELVYLIDAASGNMAIYRFNTNRKEIEPVQLIPLADMRKAAGSTPTQPAKPTGKRGSRRGRRP